MNNLYLLEFATPYSLLPTPYSLLPTPYSLLHAAFLRAFLRGSTCWGNQERSPRALLLPTLYL